MKASLKPQTRFIYKANVDQLYVLTEHWKNDIDYLRDEFRFLYSLIKNYMLWIEDDDDLREVSEIIKSLNETEEELQKVANQIQHHLHHLAEIKANGNEKLDQSFRQEHAVLEEQFTHLIKKFREAKQKAIQISEEVLDKENLLDKIKNK